MTQYLITTYTDSTGQTFIEATKARENQKFTVVLAESKEEALRTYRRQILFDACRLVSKSFKDFRNEFKNWKGDKQ
ncbi:DUF1381 domain-containing protein [Staphylococcus pseudintermedius]|nr:DUF1381 domain-containing protein [Staphylococcus pseudintermedius]